MIIHGIIFLTIIAIAGLFNSCSDGKEERSELLQRYDSIMALPPDTTQRTSQPIESTIKETDTTVSDIEIDETEEDMSEEWEEYMDELYGDESEEESTGNGYTIDQYLDDYEEYLLTVFETMKRMKSNDPSAIQEYTDALQQAQEISNKLNGMQGQMQPHHIERMMELNQKIAQASQGF